MANITIRQLHYFLALAQAGSFSKAAEMVGVTQSTLSAAIQALEIELGAELIDRGGRRIQLLAAGDDLVARARNIVAQVAELPEHARLAEQPLTTRLRMGVIPSVAPFVLPKLFPSVSAAFPQLHLTVREGLTAPLLEAVSSGARDVALIAQPYDLQDYEVAKIGCDRFFLAVKRDHALSNRDRVDAEDLRDLPFLLLENGHCLRTHVLSAIGSRHLSVEGDVHATSIATLVQLVDYGMGVTMLPEVAIKAGVARGTDLSFIPYEGPHNYRSLVLVWRKNSARRHEYELFARHLRETCLADYQDDDAKS